MEMQVKDAIGLLRQMALEQRQLSELWGRFTLATKRLEEVLTYADTMAKGVHELEQRQRTLESELAHLAPQLEEKKRQIGEEEKRYRAALKAESDTLQRTVEEHRQADAKARETLEATEQRARARTAELDKAIATKEQALKKLQEDFTAFRHAHGLA